MKYWDSAPVKALRRLIIKSPLYKKTELTYRNQMLFENKDGGKIMLSDLIQAFSLSGTIQGYQAWKKETKAKK